MKGNEEKGSDPEPIEEEVKNGNINQPKVFSKKGGDLMIVGDGTNVQQAYKAHVLPVQPLTIKK